MKKSNNLTFVDMEAFEEQRTIGFAIVLASIAFLYPKGCLLGLLPYYPYAASGKEVNHAEA